MENFKGKPVTRERYVNLLLSHLNSIAWTPAVINAVIKTVDEKRLHTLQWITGDFGISLVVRDKKLFCEIERLNFSVEVVCSTNKQLTIETLYKDPLTTADSRDVFYSKIKQRYVGITKSDVHAWLKKHGSTLKNKKLLKEIKVGDIVKITGNKKNTFTVKQRLCKRGATCINSAKYVLVDEGGDVCKKRFNRSDLTLCKI